MVATFTAVISVLVATTDASRLVRLIRGRTPSTSAATSTPARIRPIRTIRFAGTGLGGPVSAGRASAGGAAAGGAAPGGEVLIGALMRVPPESRWVAWVAPPVTECTSRGPRRA